MNVYKISNRKLEKNTQDSVQECSQRQKTLLQTIESLLILSTVYNFDILKRQTVNKLCKITIGSYMSHVSIQFVPHKESHKVNILLQNDRHISVIL